MGSIFEATLQSDKYQKKINQALQAVVWLVDLNRSILNVAG